MKAVADDLTSLDPDGTRISKVLRRTYDMLLDGQHTGRYRWDQLYKTEKTHFGTLVEINLQREFGFADGKAMDFAIRGIDVDCKYSQDLGDWMIPPEALGHIILGLWASDNRGTWSLGLVRADDPLLTASRGRLARQRIISRTVVATVAQQEDYMKRVRGNGGSRSSLRPEGIVIIGQYESHKRIAQALRIPVPGLGESVSVRLARWQPAPARPSAIREVTLPHYRVVEVCAGAGGQSLGLELAGFEHELSVELDADACATLKHNRPHWKIAQGDVASPDVWSPAEYAGTDLLAGGVPCPPFTIAGKQLGATDERDLFAWAVELCGVIGPRALLLENVRGLSMPRFAAYRQRVLDRLAELGYAAEWRLLHASDYGVPQLRPRFVLVAMRPDDFAYFTWPHAHGEPPTVGETLLRLMAANGWPGATAWAAKANDIAPTIVGGSKKHGGPDLGPTRAKRAWRDMGVDALGLANAAPAADAPTSLMPKLTCDMVARLQGWNGPEYRWEFTGRKTANYRQIGNAFPPPVARAIGDAIRRALDHEGEPSGLVERSAAAHDPVYAVLRDHGGFLTMDQTLRRLAAPLDVPAFERHLAHLRRDFSIEVETRASGDAYRLGAFKAFVGQDDHLRHEAFINPTKIS